MAVVMAEKRKAREIQPYRWTRLEYEKMVEIGLFSPEARLELIKGEILTMAVQTSYHAVAISKAQEALRHVYGENCYIRVQMPLAVSDDSEPEPDIAVVEGTLDDYWHEHPKQARLVVEVSYSTLEYDRKVKRPLYALAHIPEYWILNLHERQLEIYRNPHAGTYQSEIIMHPSDLVAPLTHSDRLFSVGELLPR